MNSEQKKRIGPRNSARIKAAKELCCDIAGVKTFSEVATSELALIILGLTEFSHYQNQLILKAQRELSKGFWGRIKRAATGGAL